MGFSENDKMGGKGVVGMFVCIGLAGALMYGGVRAANASVAKGIEAEVRDSYSVSEVEDSGDSMGSGYRYDVHKGRVYGK